MIHEDWGIIRRNFIFLFSKKVIKPAIHLDVLPTFKGALSGLSNYLLTKYPLKMKNAFYFTKIIFKCSFRSQDT